MPPQSRCPACGTVPVHHAVEYAGAITDRIFSPIFSITDAVWRAVAPLIDLFHFEHVLPPLFVLFSAVGLGTIVREPDAHSNLRDRCLWESARVRGILMWEFRLFGLPREIFVSRFRGKVHVFDGLPRPQGSHSASLLWMDDKGEMKKRFLAAHIPVAKGGTCRTEACALSLFKTLAPPVVVKPRTGSRSRHTTTHIRTEAELSEAFRVAKELSPWAVVEEELVGPVFRGTLIGGHLVGIVRRDPPQILGDGKQTVRQLALKENKNPIRRGPIFHPIAVGDEASEELMRQGLTWESVPKRGENVTLSQKVNRGAGGTIADVTDIAHQENKRMLERVGEVLKDPLVGIDFIIKDVSKPWTAQSRCGTIECNSLPFLDLHHYPSSGKARDAAGTLWNLIFPVSGR